MKCLEQDQKTCDSWELDPACMAMASGPVPASLHGPVKNPLERTRMVITVA